MESITMATICPGCTQTVRPVVTINLNAKMNAPLRDRLDEDRGLHCPRCEYRFADSDEVYTGGYR